MPKTLMVVGSLNRDVPYFASARGVGLSVFEFEPDRWAPTLVCEDRGMDNPTFLAIDPRSRRIYGVTEVFGWPEGTVNAYQYDPAARRLVYINKQPSLGSTATHCSLDPSFRHLLVANYGIGPQGEGPDRALAIYSIRSDGGLSPAVASAVHRGQGPRADRQERSHPHCILASPDGRFAIVSDLGLDALMTYSFGADGALSPAPVAVFSLPPGSGPRHFAFHPNGRLAVVIRELDSVVSILRYDVETGSFSSISSHGTLPDGFAAESHSSEVLISPDGRFIYGANRGHDSIASFALDVASGSVALLGHNYCGGRTPRNMTLDPSGRYLVVANQNSDVLTIFAIDSDSGTPSRVVGEVQIGSPMCVRFLTLN